MDASQKRFGIIKASASVLFAAEQLQLSYPYKEPLSPKSSVQGSYVVSFGVCSVFLGKGF